MEFVHRLEAIHLPIAKWLCKMPLYELLELKEEIDKDLHKGCILYKIEKILRILKDDIQVWESAFLLNEEEINKLISCTKDFFG